jgi:hypothetical protein
MRIITVCRKPCTSSTTSNVLEHKAGALNIDCCRIQTEEKMSFSRASPYLDSENYQGRTWNPTSTPGIEREQHQGGRWPANLILDGQAVNAKMGAQSGNNKGIGGATSGSTAFGQNSGWNKHNNITTSIYRHQDQGTAARYFKQVRSK